MRRQGHPRDRHRGWSLHCRAEEDRRERWLSGCPAGLRRGFRQEGQQGSCRPLQEGKCCPQETLREFRLEDVSAMNVGDVLKADVFAAGDKVDVVGVSKGKGYQGVIKRYGQHRLRESHGTGPVARHAVPTAPLLPLSRVPRQAPARPHGLCARHRAEPDCCQG